MLHVPFNRSALAYPTVQKNVTAAGIGSDLLTYSVLYAEELGFRIAIFH